MARGSTLGAHRSLVTRYRKKMAQTLRGRILDCGSGVGEYLPHLRGDVVCLDREPDALRWAACVKKVVADAEAIPFADGVFDGIWACAMAQFVHFETFLSEALRVTSPGGRILILVPNVRSPWDCAKRLLGMETWKDQRGVLEWYTVRKLRKHGRVTGEVQFLPGECLLRRFPHLGHTLMLEIVVREAHGDRGTS